ncbi:MAG: hypothetical protein ACOY0R_18590 [Chloroflexota bacterium]
MTSTIVLAGEGSFGGFVFFGSTVFNGKEPHHKGHNTCPAVSHRRPQDRCADARGIPAAVAGGARVVTVVSFVFEKVSR